MKVVVAFGGNAIAKANESGSYDEQFSNVRSMSLGLAQLVESGLSVVVTHGNGPQVGQIALQQDAGITLGVPPMPLDAAGAMSQGLIGYMLQQTLGDALRAIGAPTPCVTVITQVVVAADDRAFKNPTKPIGRFYAKREAESLESLEGWTMVEDAGRGYRRVVPSPRPLRVVEWPAIKALIDSGALVIAAGGGGIPVVETHDGASVALYGVEAVIDKDRASAELALLIGADTLVLLTDVGRVAVGYGTVYETWLDRITVSELRKLFEAGEFPAGSMGPKVESALRFLEDGGERAIITSADNMVKAITSGGGTEIVHS